jgi:formylglycine-generating enzyme required for sulfatase activity
MELVRVEAGTFKQGSPPDEARRGADELQREVVLTRPFYIGKHPVTYRQFTRFVDETRFRTEAETGTSGGYGWDGTQLVQRREFNWRNPGFAQSNDHPVVLVTYPDAEAFTNWLSRKSGRRFQLPTEAQWEYACRAGTPTAFPSGNSPDEADAMIWHKGNSPAGTQPVGRKTPNPWGIHDMLGLTWEWCADFYGPYGSGRVIDPVATAPGAGERPRRVLRGGSWLKDISSCRSATRYRNDPKSRNADNGFRVVTFEEARASVVAPRITPGVAEPKLEREDGMAIPSHDARVDPAPPPPPVPIRHARSSSRFSIVSPIALFFFGLLAILIVKTVRALLKGSMAAIPANPIESLRGSFEQSAPRPAGPLTTRVVDDGFWIQSSELPAGTLLTCRYAADEGSKELHVRFEPGPQGQFVFTGSRPRTLSVVVVPRGGGAAADIAQTDLSTWQQQRRNDDDDADTRFRGFPPAY